MCASLADGLERGPGVGPADLQRRVVVEDVVAELLQRGLRIWCGKLSCLLHLLTDRNINFLTGQRGLTLIPTPPDKTVFEGKAAERKSTLSQTHSHTADQTEHMWSWTPWARLFSGSPSENIKHLWYAACWRLRPLFDPHHFGVLSHVRHPVVKYSIWLNIKPVWTLYMKLTSMTPFLWVVMK